MLLLRTPETMEPAVIGKKYDKIADWWHQKHNSGIYGLDAFNKALNFHAEIKTALDVGCGTGGRFVKTLVSKGCDVHGIDVSERMVEIAQECHPGEKFEAQDICSWEIDQKYDLIYAWDSIFHLPLNQHQPVLEKLCSALNPDGILLYTFGNATGEHTDEWMNDTFHYSSIGINENIKLLMESNLTILHLELDQYPERHVVVIGKLTTPKHANK